MQDDKINKLVEEVFTDIIKEEKGGIETKTDKQATSAFGMSLKELTSIISTGTETEKVLQSSDAALKVFMDKVDIKFDYSSASSLADSYKFLDLSDEMVLKEKCESLGGLMSKMSLVSGLVSIKSQFNAQAGGFVNEAYIASLMRGETVPVRTGGIEDLFVTDGGKRIGISLKVKKTEKLGGSFGNLCETLSIPYKSTFSVSSAAKSGRNKINTIRNGGQFGTTEVAIQRKGKDEEEQLRSRTRTAYVKPPEVPINDGGLFYVNFFGGGDELAVLVNKVTKEDIIKSSQPDENGFYDIAKLNNILTMKVPRTNDEAVYRFKSKFVVEEYNKILQNNLKDVYESLSKLDAWFGDLKVNLSSYVSTLDKREYDKMQSHLSQGASFTFKAFDLSSSRHRLDARREII